MENTFIDKLKLISSDDELREIIKEKGKPPKVIPGIIYDDYNEFLMSGHLINKNNYGGN